MRILIQAYKGPPVNQPGAMRLFHLANALRRAGNQLFIQTSANQHLFPQDASLELSEVPQQQIITRDLRAYRHRKGQTAATIPTVDKQQKRSRFFHKLYHSYPFVLFTGDGGRTYIRKSIRAASQLIEQEGITHIFSSYRPWADHLIAYRLKKKYPQLIWIADFRDRPVDPIRQDVWWPALQQWWQGRILRRVDVVTTVSEGLAQHFRQDHKRVVVVRNGLPKRSQGLLTAPVSRHFKISYTGSLYPGLQTADLLFQTLRKLINEEKLNPAHLELHYAGKDGALWQQWASRYALGYLCVRHGFVPAQLAGQLQEESQANVLLSWSAENYGGIMTAKLGSYLSAGRPIIGILNGPDDPELRDAIEKTGAGKLFSTTTIEAEAAIESYLLDLYRTWSFSGAVPWRISPEMLQPYTWPYQLTSLLGALSPSQAVSSH